MEKICWKGHASMLGANTMWGLMSPISKFVMLGGAVTPLVVTDLRIFGAMILFWVVSFFRKPEHVGHKDLSSPGDASIITTSMPLWAMVLSALILKEPITGKKVLGIAAGASGALLLILGSRSVATSATKDTAIWGDLLVLTAQCSYALYIVLFKNFVSKYSLITIMKWMFTYAFICVLPFSADSLMATDWAALHWAEIGGLAFIVVGATFGCYVLVVVGQKTLRPTVAGMYNYIQPVVACIVAICWGMDSFNITKGFAVLLIFGGVYLVTSSRSRKEVEAYEAKKLQEESANK